MRKPRIAALSLHYLWASHKNDLDKVVMHSSPSWEKNTAFVNISVASPLSSPVALPWFQARFYTANLYTQLLFVHLHETSWRRSESTPLLFIQETQKTNSLASSVHSANHSTQFSDVYLEQIWQIVGIYVTEQTDLLKVYYLRRKTLQFWSVGLQTMLTTWKRKKR